MAGPGGGPPRKSHTKSKKGCKTCKKRHIRCDETFPQCRNCTKHNCRCDYQDQLAAGEELGASSSSSAAQSSNPELEVDQWLQSGTFPFPELEVQNTNQFAGLGRTDLRLIHHLCNAYRQLYQKNAVIFAPWINQLPNFLEISGRGHRCVLSALLAFSAQRLAVAGHNANDMINLADNYRAHALQTIQGALGNFSQENADSILATSIILSWQVDDLASWNSLMQGISTVINHMGDWKYSSPIASFAESSVLARPTSLVGNDHSLGHAIAAMQQFSDMVPKDSPFKLNIQGCWQAGLEISSSYHNTAVPQLFNKLAYLRNRVLWAPLDCLSTMGISEMSLIAIAQYFAMACAVDASLPELSGACLGALTPSAIDQIDVQLRFASQGAFLSTEQTDLLMRFPRHMMQRYPQQSTSTAEPTFSFTQAGPSAAGGSPFMLEGIDMHSTPGTPPYPPTVHYMESPSMSEISMPPSPYLASYTGSHRHSAQFQSTPRPGSIYSERGSLSVPVAHESPRFSPSYSPQPETPAFFYGSETTESPVGSGFASGLVNSEIWV